MKLLKFFKKDKTENELEKIMIKGGRNLKYRNQFYEELLTSELLYITKESVNSKNEQTIRNFENGNFPIFTSEKRILEGKERNIHYVKIKGKKLFEILNKETIIINPFSKYTFTIPSETINNILNEIVFTSKQHEMNTNNERIKITFKPIKIIPKGLTNDLIKYFRKESKIKQAYIFEAKRENENEFNIMIALDSKENIRDNIANTIIPIAEPYCHNNRYIDFIQIVEKDVFLNQFLKKIKPFYK